MNVSIKKTKSGPELKKIGNEGLLNLFAVNLPANDFACCENDRKNTNMIVRIIKRLLHTCQKKYNNNTSSYYKIHINKLSLNLFN